MMKTNEPKDSRNTNSERSERQLILKRSNKSDLESAEQRTRALTAKMTPFYDNKDQDKGSKQNIKRDTNEHYYSWFVVIGCFLCNGVIFGIINSYGTILVALKNMYDRVQDDHSMKKASLIGSILIGSTFGLSPIAGLLSDRLGIRTVAIIGGCIATAGVFMASFVTENFAGLCLTFVVMYGLGSSLVLTPSAAIIGHYFIENKGRVNGFVNTGGTIFGLALPHLFKLLFDEIGISMTFRFLSGFVSILVVASLSFKSTIEPTKEPSQTKNKDSSTGSCSSFPSMDIWRNKTYLIWVIGSSICLFGHFIPYHQVVAYTEDVLPGRSGETLLTCISISNGLGKILFGEIADLSKVADRLIQLQQSAFIMTGICIMMITTIPYFREYSYAALIVFCMLFGIFDGCFPTLKQPTATYIFGVKGSTQAIGFLLGIITIPLTIGPFIAGIILEELNSFLAIFILAGCLPIVGSIFMCVIYLEKSPKRHKKGTEIRKMLLCDMKLQHRK